MIIARKCFLENADSRAWSCYHINSQHIINFVKTQKQETPQCSNFLADCLIAHTIHNYSSIEKKITINPWSDIQNRFLSGSALWRLRRVFFGEIRDTNIPDMCVFLTCSGCDCLGWFWSSPNRCLATSGGWNFDTFHVSWDLFPVMLLQLPGLFSLLPLLSPSLDLRMIVRIGSAALAIKVVHQYFLFLFNDLNVIILVIYRVWGWFPRRVRKFWRRGRLRSWKKVQTWN